MTNANNLDAASAAAAAAAAAAAYNVFRADRTVTSHDAFEYLDDADVAAAAYRCAHANVAADDFDAVGQRAESAAVDTAAVNDYAVAAFHAFHAFCAYRAAAFAKSDDDLVAVYHGAAFDAFRGFCSYSVDATN